MSPEEKKVLMQTFSREEEDRQRRIDKKSLAPYELKAQQMERQEKKQRRSGGGGGGGSSDLRELQLGYDLDPKAMMRNFGEYAKGGNVGSKGQGLPRGKATYSAHQTMVEDGDADNITVERNPNDKRLNHLYRSPIGGNFKNLNEASEYASELQRETRGMKKGGKVKKMASVGKVSSASSRGDGCAQRGKTRGRMV